jgi:hypothetical protein
LIAIGGLLIEERGRTGGALYRERLGGIKRSCG